MVTLDSSSSVVLEVVASTGLDTKSPSYRRDVISVAEELLREDSTARSDFVGRYQPSGEVWASHGNGWYLLSVFTASSYVSVHGAKRLVHLYHLCACNPAVVDDELRASCCALAGYLALVPKHNFFNFQVRGFLKEAPIDRVVTLCETFYKVATLSSTPSSTVVAALSLGWALEVQMKSPPEESRKHHDWWDALVSHTVSSFTRDVDIAQDLIRTSFPSNHESFLRTMLLKLRSHPDKALGLLAAYVPYCHEVENFASDDLRNCLYEHLTSPSRSDDARSGAAACLSALAPTSLETICGNRLPMQATGKRAIYELLVRRDVVANKSVDDPTATKVLQFLSDHPVTKTDAAVQDAWYAALVEWMVLSQQSLGEKVTCSNIKLWGAAVERGHGPDLAKLIPKPSPSKNKPIDALYAAYWSVLNGKSAPVTREWLGPILDLLPSTPIIAQILPTIASNDTGAIAKCIIWGRLHGDKIKDVASCQDAPKLISEILQEWKTHGEERRKLREKAINETEESATSQLPSPNFTAMRSVAKLKSSTVPETMLLLHSAPHKLVSSSEVLGVWRAVKNVKDWGRLILEWCSSAFSVEQEAAWRVVRTFGRLSSRQYDDDLDDFELGVFEAMHTVCVTELCPALRSRLEAAFTAVRDLQVHDVKLLWTGKGTLVSQSVVENKANKRLTEEEEWDLEIKRELQAKKQDTSKSSISHADPRLLAEQDARRVQLKVVLEEYNSVLIAIQKLVTSDIEVGNQCLAVLSDTVYNALTRECPITKLLPQYAESTKRCLFALTTCVYEIEEKYCADMTSAIYVSARGQFPAQFDPASTVIKEMDGFADPFSGGSWSLLFPVVRACLMGPRTPNGCEGCLRVLSRQTSVFTGELKDPSVISLRKEMSITVLELLKYDRSRAFRDPDPYETLSSCYSTDTGTSSSSFPLSTAELSPLLDERGALGARNCRVGSMTALHAIGTVHSKFLRMNPLVENRVWTNCFDEDEDVRFAAWAAWAEMQGCPNEFSEATIPKPSPLYAAPLLALLNHADPSISSSASKAYAHAMGLHPQTIGRNVEGLCKAFIESFPSEAPKLPESNKSLPSTTALASKKKVVTGLPRKKAGVKKSALEVAGIGRPKSSTKKKSTHAALLQPKKERTMDQEALANQFKSSKENNSEEEEKDSPQKVCVRLGVLKTIGALPTTTINIPIDEASLKLLTSFLMAYGIADSDVKVKGMARNVLGDVLSSFGDSQETVVHLMPHLEAVLKTGEADESTLGSLDTRKVPKSIDASDRRKEGAVVALGALAVHLVGPDNDDKIDGTVDMLVAALRTPSEEVQKSVADTLVQLMKKGRTQERIESLFTNLMEQCLAGSSLALRRGSAYGLAAAVKGSGIATLKKYKLVSRLDEACSSGDATSKEGSLFAIELLSSRLGLLFEPHVIVLLPALLKSFSDSSDHVRKAAGNASGLIMSKLSAHGVKLVLPAVLEAFGDSAWRTKQASIHMLGAMSHLAPKQLASALPKVVPQLTGPYLFPALAVYLLVVFQMLSVILTRR